jgi:hypothetical protein
MRASYSLLLVLGITAAAACETSYVQAQSSPSDIAAFRKLREGLGLAPSSQEADVAVAPPASAPAVAPVPSPAPASVTADDFKHPTVCIGDQFIIAFPGKHDFKEEKERHAREYNCVANDGKAEFHVEVVDLAPAVDDSNVQQLFDEVRDELLKLGPARLNSDRSRPQAAHPGRELAIQSTAPGQSAVLNVRLVFAEHRLYIVTIRQPGDMAPSVVAAYLDSFQTAEAVQASKKMQEEFKALFNE